MCSSLKPELAVLIASLILKTRRSAMISYSMSIHQTLWSLITSQVPQGSSPTSMFCLQWFFYKRPRKRWSRWGENQDSHSISMKSQYTFLHEWDKSLLVILFRTGCVSSSPNLRPQTMFILFYIYIFEGKYEVNLQRMGSDNLYTRIIMKMTLSPVYSWSNSFSVSDVICDGTERVHHHKMPTKTR